MSLDSKIKISLLLLAVLAASAVFLLRSALKDIGQASDRLLAERNNFFSLESKIKNLEKFETEYEKLRPDLEEADSLLVQSELPVDFIRFLEEISLEAGINLKISPAPAVRVPADPWPSSNFQLSLAGPYPRILKVIGKLGSGKYLTVIQIINFSRLSDAELGSKELKKFSAGDVKGNVAIKIFAK